MRSQISLSATTPRRLFGGRHVPKLVSGKQLENATRTMSRMCLFRGLKRGNLKVDSTTYRAIRKKFCPNDPAGFLIELGFEGNDGTLKTKARRFENGDLPIPKRVARMAWLMDQWRLVNAKLDGDLSTLPSWPEGL